MRTIWGCEMEQEMAVNAEMSDFVKAAIVMEPLNPRHAFYGGRTNPISLYCKAKEDETIKYTDICR